MQIQISEHAGQTEVDVPVQLIRTYVVQLIRMHMVAAQVQPGHPWFDHQMQIFQKAATALRQRTGPTPSFGVWYYALHEARARLREYGTGPMLTRHIAKRMGSGLLPLINTNAPL